MRKRIISILTVLSVMMTVFIPVSSVHAELGIENELQVSLLAALNIVPGYPSSYKADAKVSAEDFVRYAYRLTGADLSDVASEVKAYGLNADGAETDGLSAIKIVVDLMGYNKLLDIYKNDYYALANKIGFIKNTGITKDDGTSITYNQMVMLFWNTLNLKALEFVGVGSYKYSDKTIMEEYLKIYEGSGVVNANDAVAIDGGGKTRLGEVRIGSENYLVGNTITEHLIGSSVKFYYYDNGDKILRWIETNNSRNRAISVYGEDITAVSDTSVVYYENNKSRTLKLDADYIIIYNGKAVTDGVIGIEAVKSLNSRNYFIDNNGSGKYNVVIVNDYEYYLVDAISQNTYTVNDYSAKTSVELGKADRLTVYENGVKTIADAIKQGSVIAVAKSDDLSVISVEILNGSVTGEITAVDSEEITISGTKYGISSAYAGDAPIIGRNGTFYFDNYGRIVRCVGLKEALSQYGYLIDVYHNYIFGDNCQVEILTAAGERKILPVKQSLNVNIEKDQLITYRVNSENVITKIDTANKAYIGNDTSTDEFSMHFKGAGKYRKNNMCFNSKYLLDSATPIFVVPTSGDKDDYTMMDVASLVNNTTYDISVYDIDDYMYASCIVLKENFAEPENLRSKRSLIITNVFSGIDDEDDKIIGLEGYQQGGKVSYTVKNTEMKDNRGRYYVRDLREGDVVQIGVDVKGNVSAVQLLFKADEQKLMIAEGTEDSNKYWEGGTRVMPDLSVSFGTVTGRNAGVLLVDADGNDLTVSKEPHKFATATSVYIYENGKLYTSNKNDIFYGDKVYVQEYQGNLHEVMVVR